jgi:hypothetical protein
MRSSFAVFLNGFTLPFGVQAGERIVLNGKLGRIEVYDITNTLRAVIDASTADSKVFTALNGLGNESALFSDGNSAGILFELPDLGADTYSTANIRTDQSADGTPLMQIQGPAINGQDACVFTMYGQNTADGKAVDAFLFGTTMSHGLVATTGQVTANEGPFTTDTTSVVMVLNNVPHIVGHTYEFRLQGIAELSAVIGAWQAALLLNGSYVGTFTRIANVTASLARWPINGVVHWKAPNTSSTDDFAVVWNERTGAADLTVIGGATDTSPPRFLSCYDLGGGP